MQVDETFLTKRKYHRGRQTDQMTIVVLGLYCKEDKGGMFFKVNAKSKEELWPYLKRYIHQKTSSICTDSPKQYCGVEQMFSGDTKHLTTNHSIGEYVSATNPLNTINDLENQNRLLKKSILCRRSSKLLHQYMALHFYRRYCLEKEYKHDLVSQIMRFLVDIKRVYPGIVDGVEQEGLQLMEIDPPTVASEDIGDLVPKRPRFADIEEENANGENDDETEDDIF